MVLVGPIADLHAFLQLFLNVWIAGGSDEGWKPVEAGDDAGFYLASGNVPGPPNHRGRPEAAFVTGSLPPIKRRLSAIRPGEVLCTIVGGKHNDGVVVHSHFLELLHHRAYDVVELGHAGFVNGPPVLGVA